MSEIKETKLHSVNPVLKQLIDELILECAAVSKIEQASTVASNKASIQAGAIFVLLTLAFNDGTVSNSYIRVAASMVGISLIGLIYCKDFYNQSAKLDKFYNQKLENYLKDIFSYILTDTDASSSRTYQALLQQLTGIKYDPSLNYSPLFSRFEKALTILRRKECVQGYAKNLLDNYDLDIALKKIFSEKNQFIVKSNTNPIKNKGENEAQRQEEAQDEISKATSLNDSDGGVLDTKVAATSQPVAHIVPAKNSLAPEEKQSDGPIIENIAYASPQLPIDFDSKPVIAKKVYKAGSIEQIDGKSKIKSKNQIARPHTEDKLIHKIKKNIRKGQLEIAKQLATNISYEESWKEIEIYYTHHLSKKLISSPEKISKQHHTFKIFIINKGIIQKPPHLLNDIITDGQKITLPKTKNSTRDKPLLETIPTILVNNPSPYQSSAPTAEDEAKDGKKQTVEEVSMVEKTNIKLSVLRTSSKKQELPPIPRSNPSLDIALNSKPEPSAVSDRKVTILGEKKFTVKKHIFWVRKNFSVVDTNLPGPSLSTASPDSNQEAKCHITAPVTVSKSESLKSTPALLDAPSIAQVNIVPSQTEEKKQQSEFLKHSSCLDQLLKLKYTIKCLIASRVNYHKITSPPIFYFPENLLLLAMEFQYEFTRICNNLGSIFNKNSELFLHGGLVRDLLCRIESFIRKREDDIDLITSFSIKELILVMYAMQKEYPNMNFRLKYQRGDTGLIKATYQGIGIDFHCCPGLLRGEFPNTDYNYNDTAISLTTLGIVETGKPSVIDALIDGALGITHKVFTASAGYLPHIPIKTLIPYWDNLVNDLTVNVAQIDIRELEEILKNWIDNIIRILRMTEKFCSEKLLSIGQMTETQRFCFESYMIIPIVLDAAARKDLAKKIYSSPSHPVDESKYKKSLIAVAPLYFDKIINWLISKEEDLFAINLYEYFIKCLLKEFCTTTNLRKKIDEGFLFLKSFDRLAVNIIEIVKTRNLQPIDYGLSARILPWAVAMVLADKSQRQYLMADKKEFVTAIKQVITQIPFFYKVFLDSISIEHPKISSESLTAMIEEIYDNLYSLDKKNTLLKVNRSDKLTEFFRSERPDHKSGVIPRTEAPDELTKKEGHLSGALEGLQF